MDIVKVKNLCKSYGTSEILKNVNMTIRDGEIYGLLGPNGAGKTTIMKILVQLTKATSGTIEYWGKTMDKDSFKILSNIGNIIEYPSFYQNLTARTNLELHCSYMSMGFEDIDKMLERVGLGNKADMKVSKFSLGMKQRLGLARAMLHNPKLLILDEPINGLDPMGIQEIRNLLMDLKKKGTTILISSHILAEVQLIADRVAIINDGKILEELSIEDMKNNQDLESYFIKRMSEEAK